MILGIGGKMGSGKNLVCDIIQYLTSQDISPECIKRIKEGLPIKGYHNSKFEQKAFAGKLKQTASLLTGIPIEKFEDQEFKKTELGEDWNYYPIIGYGHRNVPVYGEPEQPMFVREFLQRLGTEAMRDGLHTNVWVNALFADYRNFHTDKFSVRQDINEPEYPNWIITDMRFPNEMDAVKEREGITIRVVRHQIETANFKPLHPSETALDESKFDYEIINDGTIADLMEKVREILTKENII